MQRWLSPEFSSLRSEQLPSDPPVAMALKDIRVKNVLISSCFLCSYNTTVTAETVFILLSFFWKLRDLPAAPKSPDCVSFLFTIQEEPCFLTFYSHALLSPSCYCEFKLLSCLIRVHSVTWSSSTPTIDRYCMSDVTTGLNSRPPRRKSSFHLFSSDLNFEL